MIYYSVNVCIERGTLTHTTLYHYIYVTCNTISYHALSLINKLLPLLYYSLISYLISSTGLFCPILHFEKEILSYYSNLLRFFYLFLLIVKIHYSLFFSIKLNSCLLFIEYLIIKHTKSSSNSLLIKANVTSNTSSELHQTVFNDDSRNITNQNLTDLDNDNNSDSSNSDSDLFVSSSDFSTSEDSSDSDSTDSDDTEYDSNLDMSSQDFYEDSVEEGNINNNKVMLSAIDSGDCTESLS